MIKGLAAQAAKPKPFLLVLSSPSGGGKTTVCAKVLKKLDWLERCVTATTRAPRPGEKNGRDYWFLGQETFAKRVKEGGFYEWARVHGNFYGTPRKELESALKKGRSQVLVIDVQGARSVRRKNKDAVLVFLVPPSFETLGKRLKNRGKDHKDVVARRLAEARNEMKAAKDYDYLVLNDKLEVAVERVAEIAKAVRWRNRA